MVSRLAMGHNWRCPQTGDVLARVFPSSCQRADPRALRELPFELLGMRSDYYSLNMGFSLAMGTSIASRAFSFL